jgi:hypothetical protein
MSASENGVEALNWVKKALKCLKNVGISGGSS